MEPRGHLAALLLVFVICTAQVYAFEDIYWEGDEDNANEFLELKEESLISGHLNRIKRDLWDMVKWDWGSSSTTTETPDTTDAEPQNIQDKLPDDNDEESDFEPLGGASGAVPDRHDPEPEPKEKTLRVTFVVMEPYQTQYSNRDSPQFESFSGSLADAVNILFESLPGTQRASLVRIQSRVSDEFSCKVTLDIVTSGFDDTDEITKRLRDHIRNRRQLGSVAVSETDFSTVVIDPGEIYNGVETCSSDQIQCDNKQCVPGYARCNYITECDDGSDEAGCPPSEDDWNQSQDKDQEKDSVTESGRGDLGGSVPDECVKFNCSEGPEQYHHICEDQRCDGIEDCYYGEDEIGCETATTVSTPTTIVQVTDPVEEEFGTTPSYLQPEAKTESCFSDEFNCDVTRCIPLINRCNNVRDCHDGTDEDGCETESCGVDDFRCNNGKCIDQSLRCNRVVDCPSEEDEHDCDCRADEFKCTSDGSCIEVRKRCDNINHCRDGSDELDCASGYFRCRAGKIIPDHQRCNRRYDCPPGDYSDEQNCPCGDGDFRCDNGHCIPATKHCDRTHDCQDGSDEQDCTYGTNCMAFEYKCSSGQCIKAEAWCNGTAECEDASDETNCPCKRDEFECRDGTCINLSLRCDGHRDCRPYGEDEQNCGVQCPADSFTCDPSSSVACAKRCDGQTECDNGEDEQFCDECSHTCDGGRCLEEQLICNGQFDCQDRSDEQDCDECNSQYDFRCANGQCIRSELRCNSARDCIDNSDELNCNETITATSQSCSDRMYQCRDGSCVNILFYCDGHTDCIDGSDEENCQASLPEACHESEFTCYDGRCIPHIRRCDNVYDCLDFSDEQKCYNSGCDELSWQCLSGQCIPAAAYCDGRPDCIDESDESNCPTSRPSIFSTTSFPLWPSSTQQVPTTQRPIQTTFRPIPTSPPSFEPNNQDGCNRNQWRCENGPCIDSFRRCDGHVDCPKDSSDEFDCPPGSPIALDLKTYPDEQTVRHGGDVVFQCRDEGPLRAPVRWVREGGRPLKIGSTDRNGRLEMNQVTSSDSGVYICQAVRYLGYPGSELRVTLTVEKSPVTSRPLFTACQSYEATCGNGQCIPKSAVCDGKIDCNDRSDEEACNQNGLCEPNQYQCANRKCVLKTWLCDSEDDCGDGSDEKNCASINEINQRCLSVEYACKSGDQCVPKSFHCDGQSDCIDGSDEIGCAPVHVTRPPSPSNLKIGPGETLTLDCEAVGVPTPLISWRLNWGHIPPKCRTSSVNGIGKLICPNMQAEDSGAYSCEAINNKGTVFAAPDAIVYVSKTTCPNGFFNSEAHNPNECIRCFCFGHSQQCRSADLFTFNMATPLGEGGTRLLGIKQNYNREIQIDNETITQQYYYQPLRNGATVTKLMNFGSNWPSNTGAHPYLTLPESYNGNQLTSYGGHIRYRVSPHSQRPGTDNSMPDIIIKGKYETLIHTSRVDKSREALIEARLTPENWQKSGRRGLVQATREDIMMALDNIELVLLRADLQNAGVNITDFSMESADKIDVALGAASLVEECTCQEGYEGRSCEKCSKDFTRSQSGPWLGDCVPQRECPRGTYGDPNSGYGCRPCPCPLTNRENQFAGTCSLGPAGNVICDCFSGFEGDNCEYCAPGFFGNPLVPGDYCKEQPSSNCNPIGTKQVRLPDECECKDKVQGRYCDQCKNDSFYLSEDFRHGCVSCFCSGVGQQCMSSNLRRKTTNVMFNVPQIVDQVRLYSSAGSGPVGAVRYKAPIETNIQPVLTRGELTVTPIERSNRPVIYYWSLPAVFSGDKVTSYGGYLRYTLGNVPAGNLISRNTASDVQLISENHLTFHYVGDFTPSSDGTLNATIQLLEKGWQRPDGKEVTHEYFLLALADVKSILIKATYANTHVSTLVSASIDTAETNGDGPQALHVEQCVCPTGYVGTSCEDCAPGYTRSSSGIYFKHCEPCDCGGHSNMCNPETGTCYDCKDNTDGENCELCKPGYIKDAYQNCVPDGPVTTPGTCNCDPRGVYGSCDEYGYCPCKRNVEGEHCDRCRQGSYGLGYNNTDGCISCYCSGVTNECHEASHYTRIPLAAPIIGENYGGYTLMDINAEESINDQFLPAPNESELSYVFSFKPNTELYWSLPVFPGNRVLSYGGHLSLKQTFVTSSYSETAEPGNDVVLVGDGLSVYYTNPRPLSSNIVDSERTSYKVPLREQGWYILNSGNPATRQDFMRILSNLRRVLVRATLSQNIYSTAIADVSMDFAAENFSPGSTPAKGVEVCMCPGGYSGTSCESCTSGYYKDEQNKCRQCNCNGHECELGRSDEVQCKCRPPYTGADCSSVGVVMELYPTIYERVSPESPYRNISLTCKYQAPLPLTIQFYSEKRLMSPPKNYTDSELYKDGWRGEYKWSTVWDTRHVGPLFECRTITENGLTLGVLYTILREPAGDSNTQVTTRPPPSPVSVSVTITSPTIKIQKIGESVEFLCQAQSRMSQTRLPVSWSKADGYLPQGRSQVDQRRGLLRITNLQVSDSGQYICETSDGISTAQATATLRVPGNEMTLPTIEIRPSISEYYQGDRIELECIATGNPAPKISWQRASRRPLPNSAEHYDSFLVIENAREEDSGDYRCIASNTAGSVDRVAVINVRPTSPRPSRERLSISPVSPSVNEGQSTRVVCTGTAAVPAGSIDWSRQDGTSFNDNIRASNGVLYVDIARLENRGVYICQSTFSGIPPVAVTISVVPQNPLLQEDNSNITVSVDNVKIPTGGSDSVECSPYGYPLPTIRWKKYNGDMGPNVSQRENTLMITNAQESDKGYYLCEGIVNETPVANIYVYVDIEKREQPRVEIWPPGEHAVTLGYPYELHCRVLGGIPEPDVTWDRNGGRPLSPLAQIQPHNVLRFERVDVNDEGEYTCSASNVAGTMSASAVLKVRSTPEVIIKPSNFIQAIAGEPLTVECRATGYPEPTVSIRSSIDEREIVAPSLGSATLRISSASDRDDGDYICSASSAAGTIDEQFGIRVDRGDGGLGGGSGDGDIIIDNPNNNLDQPDSMIAIEGKQTRLTCNASEEYEVSWSRGDRRPLQPNAVQIGSELIISDTSKADSGQYECSLINRYTNQVLHSAYTSLLVMAAPRITLRPTTQEVRPGQSPTVECVVDGDDILEVSWLPVDHAFSRRVETRGSTLIFHQIEVEDAGQYKCFARNRVSTTEAVAGVIVSEDLDRPPLESHENEQFGHVGAAVHLSCNVSQLNLRIRWTKDGRPVPRTVGQKNDGSLFIRRAQKSDSGRYDCIISDEYGRQTSNYINLHIEGPRDQAPALVSIDQPRRIFRVGANVEVLCRSRSRDTRVTWERYGTNQFVDSTTHVAGVLLGIQGVQESDAGVYRCTGTDQFGRTSYEDFNLEVEPAPGPQFPNERDNVFIARLGEPIEIPCQNTLEPPVNIEWRREYAPLPADVRTNEPFLRIDRVTESDAGVYICRVSNSRTATESRAILKVVGVVPRFDGNSWLSISSLKDPYRQFDIEISFKPHDPNGLILFSSQNQNGSGDFITLKLVDGVPLFAIDTGSGPIEVIANRPLQLNTWHTIRLSRFNSKVTMDVGDIVPYSAESSNQWEILELSEPLYIGGVPEYVNLPSLADASGFIGCVSMLILGREEKNIMVDSIERFKVEECDSCAANDCLNNGVCQEARNERGYMCLCHSGFAGLNCNRRGEACRPGLCGPGKCTDTQEGYRCTCPVTYTGKNCDVKQPIEYPAFTGSAYLAIKVQPSRLFIMSMKLKATSPVTDGIIMYCSESPRGYGGFTALTVHDGKLEFTYDLGDGSVPVVLTSNRTLSANEWTDVNIARVGAVVSLKIDKVHSFEKNLENPKKDLKLETPMFVGGVDDSIVLNNNTGVSGGFSGCIKDVMVSGDRVDIVNSSIQSANVQECSNYDRGDIPEIESVCSQCRNGGRCMTADATACSCPPEYTGLYCETRVPPSAIRRPSQDPCAAQPCRNDGVCRPYRSGRSNYTCDCPLGFAGSNCQMPLELLQSVGFNGNGYLELPGQLLHYDQLEREPAVIALAINTNNDGVLLYQREALAAPNRGDYILLRIENGRVVIDWDLGSGAATVINDEVYVANGERHEIIVKLYSDNHVYLSVDSIWKKGVSTGISGVMNADSNVYIGGIPERLNVRRYPGLTGCIEQIELMGSDRGLNLGKYAVTGRNTQRCKDSRY